ncbi:hypothetical protein F4V57_03960 [Acinetobacter qingfengensis]|uniref:Uncharacterized protein n=1 Tax=Acinetobacter qingfengensis TaxID=1262585 RepID=A0A1E7RBU1_9GAMM|nr:hypothetical protein [Acinetobacter qingfengensis]KAA8734923.1 hypothetical protein F4V57_03960 [Acinetobacter qingfengensis]OEY96909.1 hypothetical protein BJI46_11545 [Acinetobacter qingfengensis]
MKIISKETHKRTHTYSFTEEELKRLSLNQVAEKLGLDLSRHNVSSETRLFSRSNGINPTSYHCDVTITELLDSQD